MPPVLFFLLRIAVAILGLLCFHINFGIICSGSVKNVIGILIGITLNLWIVLGSIEHGYFLCQPNIYIYIYINIIV